jgi:hypothetical protein
MSTIVLLGNDNPMHQVDGPDGIKVGVPAHAVTGVKQSVTRVEMWEGFDDPETVKHALSTSNTANDRKLHQRARALGAKHKDYAIGIHELEELWAVHANGQRPAYVASSDPAFQKAIADYFGCPEGEYEAVVTNLGRDAFHSQHLNPSNTTAVFQYGALSSNTGAGFAAADTTLAGEITTNGLGRATMTYAHTSGTNTTTLTKTWTYTGSTSVTIASFATFNAASAGTMGEEVALASSVSVATSGDTTTITYTFTA